jgi:peptidoglycan/xylan/chitin deacetylase (PgdA/CDA1 family)
MKKLILTFVAFISIVGEALSEIGSRGVLLLTFDDRNFVGWEAARPIFAKYGAHVTFFVSGDFLPENVRTLKRLASDGHSIGLHGFNHRNADKYVAKFGAERYYKDEILPQTDRARKFYVPYTSFAYPNCRRNDETDALFRGKGFRRVRGGVKGATPYDPKGVKQSTRKPLVENNAVFFPVSELPSRFRIDTIIVGEAYHTDIEEICACIRRAAERREVICITSHGIAPNAKHIHMKSEWLERILSVAKECGIAALGFDELP